MSTTTRSFWSSIPGMVTGLAGILTALVGLGALLVSLGVIGDKDSSSPSTGSPAAGASGASGITSGSGRDGGSESADAEASFALNPSDITLRLLDKEAVVTVTNQGPAPLKVKAADVSGPQDDQFDVDASACTSKMVAPSTSCRITVTYKGGVESEATMTVTADDAPSDTVDLRGTLL